MPTVRHKDLPFIAQGVLPAWSVADASALAELTPVAGDVGKGAYQQDTRELWLLVNHVGPVWMPTGRRGFSSSRTVTDATDTLTLADAGGKVYGNRAAGIAITVPPNASVAFHELDVITLIQIGAGAITVTAGAGVTLVTPNGKTLVSNGASGKNAIVSLSPRPGALDTWDVYGDLV